MKRAVYRSITPIRHTARPRISRASIDSYESLMAKLDAARKRLRDDRARTRR